MIHLCKIYTKDKSQNKEIHFPSIQTICEQFPNVFLAISEEALIQEIKKV